MAQTCQYPGCESRDTYPLIDKNTNKKFHLCATHHEEAKGKANHTQSMSPDELNDRIEALFGTEFRTASFDSYDTRRGPFEEVQKQIQPRLKRIEKDLPQGKSFTLDDHLGQLRAARQGLEEFSEQMVETGRGTVVLGGTEGVGKTHLAAACVRKLIPHGYEPAVWHGTDLLTQVRATYGNSPSEEVQSVDALIGKMTRPDVLVIEDIRDSCFADDMRDYIFSIIDRVYRNQSMLIITSNYTLSDLKDPERLGPHLADRLADPPSFIQDMQGVSFRQARKAYQKKHK